MAQLETIYREIAHLSDTDRNTLYNRMQREFYNTQAVAAYATNGEALTYEQYKQRVNTGIMQCERGQSTSLEDLCVKLGYNYADI
ncbi:hypothetical protein AGMMS49965_12550 [Bacteroidia bacterium]|nr:hypothetical protein AGMMS49965_12550 [Bacteroidia bacterium]